MRLGPVKKRVPIILKSCVSRTRGPSGSLAAEGRSGPCGRKLRGDWAHTWKKKNQSPLEKFLRFLLGFFWAVTTTSEEQNRAARGIPTSAESAAPAAEFFWPKSSPLWWNRSCLGHVAALLRKNWTSRAGTGTGGRRSKTLRDHFGEKMFSVKIHQPLPDNPNTSSSYCESTSDAS